MASVTVMSIVKGELENDWVINVSTADASESETIRDAEVDLRHGIRKITVTGVSVGTQWFKILDGEDVLVGPVILATGVPWHFDFGDPIYGTLNTALKLQTQSAFKIHCIIKGVSDDMPISSPSPSPSASPS